MPEKALIAVVEDEPNIRGLLVFNMQSAGYRTVEYGSGEEALAGILASPPALVLLDLMLPGIDGMEVCRRLRASATAGATPIIMVTSKGEELDRVLGLEIGADDYITKPFSMREVVARIKSVLRRADQRKMAHWGELLQVGDITVNISQRKVTKAGRELAMPMKEFDLLCCLIERKGHVLTREQLLDRVWGYDYSGETRTVDVHIRHLRMKVEDDPDNASLIETVRGVGYRIADKQKHHAAG